MPDFNYSAKDAKGKTIRGKVAAESEDAARKILRGEGKVVVNIRKAYVPPAKKHRIKRDDVIYFVHQMAIMVETGVPIGEALDDVSSQSSNPTFKGILTQVSEDVQSGGAFSTALGKHPKIFPTLMVSLIEASEASGTMAQMLERVAAYLTKEAQTIKKVRGAMMYPAFMFTMAVSVIIFLVMFVLPKFAAIYGSKGAALPLPTAILLAVSDIAIGYWYWFVLGFLGALGGFFAYRATTGGRRAIDRWKISWPIIGKMFSQLYITRAMQSMGTMITAGVPMLEMITITRNITENVHFEEMWAEVNAQVEQGSQLSEPIAESNLIPTSIARMISSGEKAGRLGKVMERIAEFTETEFDESVKTATQFIEPVMISVMGVFIGGVAISLLLPIFSIGKTMAS